MDLTPAPKTCPPGWQPACRCSMDGDEPNDNCYVHGFPDTRKCAWCGKFMSLKCRCGYHAFVVVPP